MTITCWFRSWSSRRAARKGRRGVQRCRSPRCRLLVEPLEDRTVLAGHTLAAATVLDLTAGQAAATGLVGPNADFFAVTASTDGRLTAQVHASGCATRLSLLDAAGNVLVQSDGVSASNPDDLIDLHVTGASTGTSYYLEVQNLSSASCSYSITVGFAAAAAPFGPIAMPCGPWNVISADFNGDGVLDLATANLLGANASVFLGRGDGTFTSAVCYATGVGPWQVIAADFNGDGHLDLATVNQYSSTVSILLGRGDGTFGEQTHFAAGILPTSAVACDWEGDGHTDLVVSSSGTGVALLQGRGDGTFDAPRLLLGGISPTKIVAGDFNGDGRLGLAAIDPTSNEVAILLQRPDGTLSLTGQYAVGQGPTDLLARDFNGDGTLDLAVANGDSNSVSVLLGRGDGTFASPVVYANCPGVSALTAGDFNGDGLVDLAAANRNVGTVSILMGREDGTFANSVQYAAGDGVRCVVAGDFNRDGYVDLAVGSITPNNMNILLGRGNGTFQCGPLVSTGSSAYTVVQGDFNGDGRLDLAVANHSTKDISILLGRGDGTFQQGERIPLNADTWALSCGDFFGDGHLDLVAASYNTPDLLVVKGRGDGTFSAPQTVAVPATSVTPSMVTGDFNGDGRTDLAFLDGVSPTVTILYGESDRTFSDPASVNMGFQASSLTVGDFNGDGRTDLAAAQFFTGQVSVVLSQGDASFGTPSLLQLPPGDGILNSADFLVAGDFNGDGHTDLLCHSSSAQATFLLGEGDGTFAVGTTFAFANAPSFVLAEDLNGDGRADLVFGDTANALLTTYLVEQDGTVQMAGQVSITTSTYVGVFGDFHGDGHPDLATANMDSSDVFVYPGRGDGTFGNPQQTPIAGGPVAVAQGDLNNNGYPDLVTADYASGTVSVRLSNGDGTFTDPVTYAVGAGPDAVAVVDANGDGRVDIIAANAQDGTLSVLLGNGDGTFRPAIPFPVGSNPDALAVGDLNGDGLTDLVIANYGSNDLSIYMNQVSAWPQESTVPVGAGPCAVAVGDVNGDGILDVVVADALSRDVGVLLGRGDGTFRALAPISLAVSPTALVLGDFTGDGYLDIAIANEADNSVSILLGQGNGTFAAPSRFAVGAAPVALVAGDFTSDGYLDLAVANSNSNTVSVLAGRGDGTFQALAPYAVGSYPFGVVAADFNGSGRLGLATANALGVPITVAMGLGDGTYAAPGAAFPPIQSPPIVGDFNGDGILDVVTLRQDGRILFRLGEGDGRYAPPVIVNPDPVPAARGLSVGSAGSLLVLVAISAREASANLYTWINGQLRLLAAPSIPGIIASRVLAGDMNGDGALDVIVSLSNSRQILVYLQQPNEGFNARPPDYVINIGGEISSMTLADMNGDGLPDLVLTDQSAGVIHILMNAVANPFATQLTFPTGYGLTALTENNGTGQLQSSDAPVAAVAGLFCNGTLPDLAVLDSNANRVYLLKNDGHGGVFNPNLSFATGIDPVAIVSADFNGDGIPDLAVLNKGSNDLTILLGNGHNDFTEQLSTDLDGHQGRPSAGADPTGLAVADIDGNGTLDLLVSNGQGDVLSLKNNGDGTFQPYQRLDDHVALAVADVNQDGQQEFVLANAAADQVAVLSDGSVSSFVQGRQDGVRMPNAVKLADLNGDGVLDLIVANGGGNDVLVYPGLPGGLFGAPHSFFVGTDPVSVTVSDLNSDGISDLVVANQGSNDASVLFGQGQGTNWTLIPGPRLNVGLGPTATVVQDVNRDGIPDLLVANGQSNNVYLLPGVGLGFFNDTQPTIFQTGADPQELFVGHFGSTSALDLVTVNAGSNDLTYFPDFGPGRSIASGGLNPVAAVVGDFSRDGLSELLVANQGDSRFSLFAGTADSLYLVQTLARPDLGQPTDLALGNVKDNLLSFYVASVGHDYVGLLTFDLGNASVGPGDWTPAEDLFWQTDISTFATDLASVVVPHGDLQLPEPGVGQVTHFVSLPDATVGIVAVLLIGFTAEPTGTTAPAGKGLSDVAVAEKEDAEIGQLVAVLNDGAQTMPPQVRGPADDAEEAIATEESSLDESNDASLNRFLLGLDGSLAPQPGPSAQADWDADSGLLPEDFTWPQAGIPLPVAPRASTPRGPAYSPDSVRIPQVSTPGALPAIAEWIPEDASAKDWPELTIACAAEPLPKPTEHGATVRFTEAGVSAAALALAHALAASRLQTTRVVYPALVGRHQQRHRLP